MRLRSFLQAQAAWAVARIVSHLLFSITLIFIFSPPPFNSHMIILLMYNSQIGNLNNLYYFTNNSFPLKRL